MSWVVVERRLGRAGSLKARTARQRQWDRQYGDGEWAVGYVIDGQFVHQEDALTRVYARSYEDYFARHPEDLDELIHTAKALRNPHAEATTGVDLQVPAIMDYLRARGLTLLGDELVDIGSFDGVASHAISIRLSPLHIPCALEPKLTLEAFWQRRKCLAIWAD